MRALISTLLVGVVAVPLATESRLRAARAGIPSAPAEQRYRIVGYNDMREMLDALCASYRSSHPNVRFDLDLRSTRSAPPALASGLSLLAPMGAEFSPRDLAEYRRVTSRDPLAWRIAHASLSPRALSGPLAIIVHPSNPMTRISMTELAAIFSGRETRDDRRPVGLGPTTALGSFMREHVLHGAAFAPRFEGFAQSAEVVARIAQTPGAIGFAGAVRLTDGVKALALVPADGGAAVGLSAASLVADAYPLDRPLLIYTRSPLEPAARDFLRFALSVEGQRIVGSGSLGYLALSRFDADHEMRRLEEAP